MKEPDENFYMLIDGKVVKTEDKDVFLKWAQDTPEFNNGSITVEESELKYKGKLVRVYTWFTALNLNNVGKAPICLETVVYGSFMDLYRFRHFSLEEAKLGHVEICKQIHLGPLRKSG